MDPHALRVLAASLTTFDLAEAPTEAARDASTRMLGTLGSLDLGLSRFQGQPPWERHAADELLFVVDGSVELTVVQGDDRRRVRLEADDLFVMPAGAWHRSLATAPVTILFATPREGNERGFNEDPPC